MSAAAQQPIEWYIAREGRQHGPLSDVEMKKMVELGHLRPTDLVWRSGMPDWRPASVVFQRPTTRPAAPVETPQPQQGQPTSQADRTTNQRPAGLHDAARGPQPFSPQQVQRPDQRQADPTTAPAGRGGSQSAAAPAQPREPQSAQPQRSAAAPAAQPIADERMLATIQAGHQSHPGDEMLVPPARPERKRARREERDEPTRRWPGRLAAVFAAAVIGAGAAAAVKYTGLKVWVPAVPSLASLGLGSAPGASRHSAELLTTSPFLSSGDSIETIDGAFQKTAVWRVVKREFPDWYAERVKETAGMRTAKRENEAVTRHLAESLVALRRKHADQALSATPERLGSVAAAFLESLRGFAKHSVEACYGYISQGETNPVVLKLSSSGIYAQQLQKQVTAVFDAISDGRKSPTTYLPPRRADYDSLAQELTGRGWSATDLQTFSDPRALARSTPEQVCKMVQDWFAAQMAIKDGDARQRLLVEFPFAQSLQVETCVPAARSRTAATR